MRTFAAVAGVMQKAHLEGKEKHFQLTAEKTLKNAPGLHRSTAAQGGGNKEGTVSGGMQYF